MEAVGIIIDIIFVGGFVAIIVWNVKKLVQAIKRRKAKKELEARKLQDLDAENKGKEGN